MKNVCKLWLLCCLVAILAIPSRGAHSEDRHYALLAKYLDTPYSPLDVGDGGYEGILVADLTALGKVESLEVEVSNIDWNDPGVDGRADIIVPVDVQKDLAGTFSRMLLIFHNSRELHPVQLPNGKTIRQHWDPVPSVLVDQPSKTSSPGIYEFTADLNGDGLADRVKLAVPSDSDASNLGLKVGPVLNNVLGEFPLLSFRSVAYNSGFGMVAEADLPGAVRDSRLGHLAGYTESLFGAIRPGAEPSSKAAIAGTNDKSVWLSSTQLTTLRQTQPRLFAAHTVGGAGNPALLPPLPSLAPIPTNIADPTLESHHELDFDIVVRGQPGQHGVVSYIPNLSMYAAGLQYGASKGARTGGRFIRARRAIQLYSEAAQEFKQLPSAKVVTSSTDIDKLKKASDAIKDRLKAAQDVGSLADLQSEYLDAWKEIAASNVFTMLRVNADFQEVPHPVDAAVHISQEALKPVFAELNDAWIVQAPNSNQLVVNGNHAVGTALAFMNLMALRSSGNYSSKISNPGEINELIKEANEQAEQFAPSLHALIEKDPQLTGVTLTGFVTSSMSSGYRDLPGMIAADGATAAAISGYEQGQKDALASIKSFLGARIPDLQSQSSIEGALTAIGNLIKSQQQTIDSLQGIVKDLHQTVDELNSTLANANDLIVGLKATNASLQSDLDTTQKELAAALAAVQDAGKSVSNLAKSGEGFLVGGPIGAGLCVIFC